jgi:hypothetical protein
VSTPAAGLPAGLPPGLAASLAAAPRAPWPAAPDATALLPRLLTAGAAGAAGAPLHALGVTLTPKVLAGQTNNAYAIFEAAVAPGAGAPAQRGRDDLVVFVLEGELALRRRLARAPRAGGRVRVRPPRHAARLPQRRRAPGARAARQRARRRPRGAVRGARPLGAQRRPRRRAARPARAAGAVRGVRRGAPA